MASKNAKVLKPKKKKFNFNKVFFYLKSLINNGVVKEIGIKHWISSIFVMLLSLFISVMPTLTTEATRNGSSSINNQYNDVLVEAIYNYVEDETAPDLQIVDHKLSTVEPVSNSLIYNYQRSNLRFDIYYFDTDTGVSFTDQINSVLENNPNVSNAMFLGSDQYSISIYQQGSTQMVGNTAGRYGHIEDIVSFKSYLKQNATSLEDINEVKQAYMTNFYTFADQGYLDIRGQQVGMMVGIVLGINGGITLLILPILFLMSRGKNNPNRILKFYQVMGITFHATLTPAIITMILGYIMGSSLQIMSMIYVMCYGFRAMWLTMKYLRTPIQ